MSATRIAFYAPVRGSGVTSLLAHLFWHSPAIVSQKTTLIDCDIEFPTASTYFQTQLLHEDKIRVFQPDINRSHCILCKACSKACAFDAIKVFKNMAYIRLDHENCRACGACFNTCRYGAITELEREIGVCRLFAAGENREIIEAELWAEDFFYVKAIQEMMTACNSDGLVLIDARGGLDYVSLEAMHESDLVVLVIDVSLFSPEPYRQIIDYLANLGKQMVVVVNRADEVPDSIRSFCEAMNLPLAGAVPYDFAIPVHAVKACLVPGDSKDENNVYPRILRNLIRLVENGKSNDR